MNNNKNVVPGIVFTDQREKSPEEKLYLILLVGEFRDDDRKEYRDFAFKTGRKEAYNYLKDLIIHDDEIIIDIISSKIISDTVSIEDSISIYKFMKFLEEEQLVETDFDITEYSIDIGAVLSEESEE